MSSDETIQGALSDLQDLQATLEEQQYLESMYNLLTNDMSEDLANFMKKIMRSGGELSENEVLSMTKDEIAKYMVGSSRVSLLPVSGRLPESILKSSTPFLEMQKYCPPVYEATASEKAIKHAHRLFVDRDTTYQADCMRRFIIKDLQLDPGVSLFSSAFTGDQEQVLADTWAKFVDSTIEISSRQALCLAARDEAPVPTLTPEGYSTSLKRHYQRLSVLCEGESPVLDLKTLTSTLGYRAFELAHDRAVEHYNQATTEYKQMAAEGDWDGVNSAYNDFLIAQGFEGLPQFASGVISHMTETSGNPSADTSAANKPCQAYVEDVDDDEYVVL